VVGDCGEVIMSPIYAKLKDIVDALDIQDDTFSQYLDRETGRIVLITEDIQAAAKSRTPKNPSFSEEWHEAVELFKQIKADKRGRFVAILSRYDIHEYAIMRDFVLSLEDEKLSQLLVREIEATGAFRRFNQRLRRHDLFAQWEAYRLEALTKIAKKWCETEGVLYA